MKNMELKKMVPIVLYDDKCYLCIKFAKIVNLFAKEKVLLVGHYSTTGEEIRKEILDSSALEMFWYIDQKIAYGGRAALFPLIKTIISGDSKKHEYMKIKEECDIQCKTAKAVFLRSASLLTNSKKIKIYNITNE